MDKPKLSIYPSISLESLRPTIIIFFEEEKLSIKDVICIVMTISDSLVGVFEHNGTKLKQTISSEITRFNLRTDSNA